MTESHLDPEVGRPLDSRTDRLVVPDVLRGVAILAMLIAHARLFLTEQSAVSRFLIGNISDLASPLPISLMAVQKHVKVLEEAGLVATRKLGRSRHVRLRAHGLELVRSSELLRNPDDDHSRNVFDPAIKGRTDRFVHVYRRTP